MSMPGFTAEDSAYVATNAYRGRSSGVPRGNRVLPQYVIPLETVLVALVLLHGIRGRVVLPALAPAVRAGIGVLPHGGKAKEQTGRSRIGQQRWARCSVLVRCPQPRVARRLTRRRRHLRGTPFRTGGDAG